MHRAKACIRTYICMHISMYIYWSCIHIKRFVYYNPNTPLIWNTTHILFVYSSSCRIRDHKWLKLGLFPTLSKYLQAEILYLSIQICAPWVQCPVLHHDIVRLHAYISSSIYSTFSHTNGCIVIDDNSNWFIIHIIPIMF